MNRTKARPPTSSPIEEYEDGLPSKIRVAHEVQNRRFLRARGALLGARRQKRVDRFVSNVGPVLLRRDL